MNFSSIFENVSTKLTTTYRKLRRELILFETRNRSSITRFEDLSNEIIFEIFDFLDFCQIYQSFSNQNLRFQRLLYDPILILKIKLTSISMTTFDYYYRQILLPHQHYIKSLYLSNQLLIDRGFSSTSIFIDFPRLEYLTLKKIKSYYLENILEYLYHLPYLSSLSIDSSEPFRKKNFIYNHLFRLSALKFCKLSSFEISYSQRIEILNIQYHSSIEHWITKYELTFDEINRIFSRTKQLRRLSICLYQETSSLTINSLLIPQLNQLIHLILTLNNVTFDNFELFISIFCPYLKILRILIENNCEYIDEIRWRKLITSHLTCLTTFDLMISCFLIHQNKDPIELITKIEKFHSSFWSSKQWFFQYQIDRKNSDKPLLIFSTLNPYRKKIYKFIDVNPWETCSINFENNFYCVQHVEIHQENALNTNKKYYFPNTIELTLADMNKTNQFLDNSLVLQLNTILCFEKIIKLNINLFYGNIPELIELIHRLINLRRLEIHSILFRNLDLELIENSSIYQLTSTTNHIDELIIHNRCTLQIKQFLIKLCSQLQHLTIFYTVNTCKPLIKSLIFNGRSIRHRLCSLCITHIPSNYEFNTLKVFICSDNSLSMLIMNVTRGDNGQEMHLWW